MSFRPLLIAAVLATALSAAGADASGGLFHSDALTSGTAAVARCDTTPTWAYTFAKNANGQVTSVTVAAIDAGCLGGAIQLRANPAGASGGPVPISSCTATCSVVVPLSPSALPSQVTSIVAVIVGP